MYTHEPVYVYIGTYIHTVFYLYSEPKLQLVIYNCLLHINNMLWPIFPSCHIAISFFFVLPLLVSIVLHCAL